jgi:predicted short-subunit dehydrogenase-like oxidoreductase (DUF2520 family)
MNIGLIGCGKVGLTMCYFLKKSHAITGIYDSSKVRERAGLRILRLRNNPGLGAIIKKSDAILIATPDDEIAKIGSKLTPRLIKPTLICHFSGLLSAEIIPKHRYARCVSLHPFATFPSLAIPPREKKYLMLCQGDRKARELASSIFKKPHFSISHIPRRHKVWYHLLGVFSSNLLVALMKAADDIARGARINPARARKMAIGLISQTLKNAADLGLDNALSGPVRRGDIKTIEQHITTLQKNKPLLRVYCALSAYLVGLSEKPSQRQTLKKVLQKT